MLGVSGSARCYPSKAADKAADAEPPVAADTKTDDPLGLEAAFDKSFSTAKAKASKKVPDVPDDPLDLEGAFDEVTGCFGSLGGGGQSSDSSLPAESEQSDVSNDSRHGLAPGDGDSENEAEADSSLPAGPLDRPDRQHLLRMGQTGGLEREQRSASTAAIKWRGKVIGTISSWKGNVSCVCKVHSACRSPASKTWGSDAVLEDWLLLSVDESGEKRWEKDRHQQYIIAAAARARLPNRR